MPPIIKTIKEETDELIKQTAKETVDIVEKKIDEKLDKLTSTGGSKIGQIISQAKGTKPPEEKGTKTPEDLEKERHEKEHDEIPCPSCANIHSGHTHTLKKTNLGTLKCTGDGCNDEFTLLSINPDYKCKNCGAPNKRPAKELEQDAKCPFCHSGDFIKYDWSKLRKSDVKK